MRMRNSLLVIALALALVSFADVNKDFQPPMRGERDPFPAQATAYDAAKIEMEELGRGVVAVMANEEGDVAVSWRYLSKDPRDIAFDIYRVEPKGVPTKVNSAPITNATFFIDKGAYKGTKLGYEVRPVLFRQDSQDLQDSARTKNSVNLVNPVQKKDYDTKPCYGRWIVPENAPIGCFDIPITPPPDDTLPDNATHGHHANDCSVGDADGDGEYELFVKWESNASRDNIGGWTGQTWFECLKVPSGKSLWKINIGYNINAGPHYQPFLVHDFDGDGKAEMIVRTAPGAVDGKGRVLTDAGVWRLKEKVKYFKPEETLSSYDPNFKASDETVGDWRHGTHPLNTPEYLTVFNGLTGEAMDTVKYDPPFVNFWIWGDYPKAAGNRSHRFLATTAYLDGVHPSAVMCRGYYNRSCLAAWDWDGHNLRERWFFDSESPRWRGKGFSGQGFHNLRAADIDFDGKDEIVYGSMCVDDDGTGMYSIHRGHGDQIHIVQSSPNHIGLQVFTCQEHHPFGVILRDAKTGKIIWEYGAVNDTGNCLALDVDPVNPGVEFFGASMVGGIGMDGHRFGIARSKGMYYATHRFGIWWAGGMERSLLPGSDGPWSFGFDRRGGGAHRYYDFIDCDTNNSSKANPCLVADIFGDWREEALYRRRDNKAIRCYVSTFPTEYRFWSLMEDPCYRNGVAAENAGYNVCPEPSFYFGPDLRGHGIWFRGCKIP